MVSGADIRGHTLGSHTWSHPDMTTLNRDQIHNELWRVEQAFIRILGKKPLYVSILSVHLTAVPMSLASP